MERKPGKPRLPADIEQSIKEGNTAHLSAAGTKGAEVTNKKKDLAKAVEAVYTERRQAEDVAMREAANEHVLPPEGEPEDD